MDKKTFVEVRNASGKFFIAFENYDDAIKAIASSTMCQSYRICTKKEAFMGIKKSIVKDLENDITFSSFDRFLKISGGYYG